MFAIAFDLVILDLKEHYGDPYNNAYFEIKNELRKSVRDIRTFRVEDWSDFTDFMKE